MHATYQEKIIRFVVLIIRISLSVPNKTTNKNEYKRTVAKETIDSYQSPTSSTISPPVSNKHFSPEEFIKLFKEHRSNVQQFLLGIFNNAQLGPQCAIVALIFFERLVNGSELSVYTWSWRRMLFICILLSSKVLDDQAVWNVDYCQILKDVEVDDLNRLERHTLKLLQFNINVERSVYARYYFDLLTLGEHLGVATKFSERQRLTSVLATELNLLPTNLDIREDEYSSQEAFNKWGNCMMFDLPYSANNNDCNNNKKKNSSPKSKDCSSDAMSDCGNCNYTQNWHGDEQVCSISSTQNNQFKSPSYTNGKQLLLGAKKSGSKKKILNDLLVDKTKYCFDNTAFKSIDNEFIMSPTNAPPLASIVSSDCSDDYINPYEGDYEFLLQNVSKPAKSTKFKSDSTPHVKLASNTNTAMIFDAGFF